MIEIRKDIKNNCVSCSRDSKIELVIGAEQSNKLCVSLCEPCTAKLYKALKETLQTGGVPGC